MSRRTSTASYLALSVAMLSVAPVIAQTASTSAAKSITSTGTGDAAGEIVVTAQKRSESINKVPLSIVAATGEQLTSLGIKQPSDLTKIVSGFQATTSQIGTSVYYLRGVGYDDIAVAARPTVTLYNDEAPLPYSAMAIGTTLDLERVEVLKGPQGLLFGSNSTGGAINFIAAKPTDTFEAGVDASIGRFKENNVSAFISGPANDWLGIRLAASHQGMDDWQYDYVDGKTIGQRNNWSRRLTFVAKPSSDFSARLTLFGAADLSDPQIPQYVGYDAATALPQLRAYPTAPANDRATSFDTGAIPGLPLRKDNYTAQATLRLDYHMSNDITLTSLSAYAQNREKYAYDADGTELKIVDFGVQGKIKSLSQELRLAGDMGPIKWIVGGNVERDKTRELVPVNIEDTFAGHSFSGPPFNFPPIQVVPTRDRTKFDFQAAFGNLEYAVSSKITLRGGLRYTHATTDFQGCAVQQDPTSSTGIFLAFGVPASYLQLGACQTLSAASILAGHPVPTLFTDKIREHNLSWRAGIDFTPVPGTLTYASISRGYKAGAFSSIAATIDSQLEPVPQEELTAYEVGFKSDIVRSVLHLNGALFYYDYRHKQLQGTELDPIFGPLQALVSVPKSRIWGAELEATVRPIRGLTLGGMATYVNTKVIESFVNFTRFGVEADLKGHQFPNTPKWQIGGNAEYRSGLSQRLDWFVNSNITYRSSTYGDFFPDPRLKIDAYKVVDAQLGIEAKDKSWKAAIYGRNIFNEYYWTNQIRPQDAISRYTGMPATYGLQVSFRFH